MSSKHAPERRSLVIDWIEADLSWYAPESDTYDLVLICFLHTDSGERSHWLPHAVSAVRPGGTFLCLAHDCDNPARGHGGPQNPDNLPSLDELRGYLEGFAIQKASTMERDSQRETGHGRPDAAATALDTLLKAERAPA